MRAATTQSVLPGLPLCIALLLYEQVTIWDHSVYLKCFEIRPDCHVHRTDLSSVNVSYVHVNLKETEELPSRVKNVLRNLASRIAEDF